MNNVYENNMRFLPLLKFIEKHKKILISIVVFIILVVSYFVITNQIAKQKNESAALIYGNWSEEISSENPDEDTLNLILNDLLSNYGSTGYAQIALLNKASLDAQNNKLEEALKNFKELISITDKSNGSKIYNKIARVSAARILVAEKKYDEALSMIEIFSSNSTNGYIHELTGDILAKQDKTDLALAQYKNAADKYSDEISKSIISMKIANIGNQIEN